MNDDLTEAEQAAVDEFPDHSWQLIPQTILALIREAFVRGWAAHDAALLAAHPADESAWRKAIADQVRANCTPSPEAYAKGGDVLIYAVADWIESPPEWSKFEAPAAHPVTAIDREAIARVIFEHNSVAIGSGIQFAFASDRMKRTAYEYSDALLASGVLGIPADHPVPETLATYTVTRTPITAGAKTAAGYEPVAFEYQAKSGTDAIAQAVKDCEWRDPRQNFSWRVTSRKVAEQ